MARNWLDTTSVRARAVLACWSACVRVQARVGDPAVVKLQLAGRKGAPVRHRGWVWSGGPEWGHTVMESFDGTEMQLSVLNLSTEARLAYSEAGMSMTVSLAGAAEHAVAWPVSRQIATHLHARLGGSIAF